MNKLKTFENHEFGKIRTIEINNEPYLMLNDVCKILEMGNPSQVKARLKEDGVITNEVIDSIGRTQIATFINESNLYKVIFHSRKPQAEKFTNWVTNEVLPSIRQNGGYITNQENMSESELLANAVMVAQNIIENQKRKLQRKEEQLKLQEPKVLFADAVSASSTSILIGELAKLMKQNGLDIGQNRLFELMRNDGFLVKGGSSKNLPTQKAMDMKLLEIKERTINEPNGSIRITKTTKVTGKGQQYLINRYLKI